MQALCMVLMVPERNVSLYEPFCCRTSRANVAAQVQFPVCMQTTSYTRPILLRSSAFVHARSPRRQLTYPSALPAFSAVAQRSLQRRANNRGNFSLYAAVGDQHVTANLPEVGQAETERRLAKAIGLIQTADDLAPYDRIGFSAPLTIWTAIQDIPPAARKGLLDSLGPIDIRCLWKIAGQRYQAPKQQTSLTVGSYTIFDDMPTEPGQVVMFDGKADAVFSGLFRFRKAFFLHPQSEEVYGRVQLQKGPLGNVLYPLYFSCSIAPAIVPATEELTDMQLEYLSPSELNLAPDQLPEHWPQPKEPSFPFDGGLTDYCRMVAPGVLVGVGWKAARPGKDIGRRFLHFMLVRKYN